MSKNFGNLRDEWVEGLETAKADGDTFEYVAMTAVITVGAIIVTTVVIFLLLAILKAVFWPLMIGILYVVAAKLFGWPTPLDLLKKVFGK